MSVDLFGVPDIGVWKTKRKHGYAGNPGRGPAGETCQTCDHYCRVRTGGDNVYRKCGLVRANWTCGPGTDIKAKSPACQFWRKP